MGSVIEPVRLIPVYAGSTARNTWHSASISAHPRLRGEHYAAYSQQAPAKGSSPSTRGAQWAGGAVMQAERLIPVYAGSTSPGASARVFTSAHPRLRGEHPMSVISPDHFLGSSPSTRGAQRGFTPGAALCRLIPVYAGSTEREIAQRAVDSAHPRLRGEHRVASTAGGLVFGSSPSTRGALCFVVRTRGMVRLIPVYAGSTLDTTAVVAAAPAHPRLRGEHLHTASLTPRMVGSSPSTRGARHDDDRVIVGYGLIPVYAGSTCPWLR